MGSNFNVLNFFKNLSLLTRSSYTKHLDLTTSIFFLWDKNYSNRYILHIMTHILHIFSIVITFLYFILIAIFDRFPVQEIATLYLCTHNFGSYKYFSYSLFSIFILASTNTHQKAIYICWTKSFDELLNPSNKTKPKIYVLRVSKVGINTLETSNFIFCPILIHSNSGTTFFSFVVLKLLLLQWVLCPKAKPWFESIWSSISSACCSPAPNSMFHNTPYFQTILQIFPFLSYVIN